MNISIDTQVSEERIPKGLAPNAVLPPLTDEEYAEILRMAGIVASPGIPLP